MGPKIINRSIKSLERPEYEKESWIEGQYQEVEACLRKNNSEKGYQLVKGTG